MARSYRKPYYTDQQNSRDGRVKQAKRAAARRVRASEDLPDGGAYKKAFNPWDIRDWSFHAPQDPKARRK